LFGASNLGTERAAPSSTLKGVVPGEVILVISARWGAGSSTGLKNACKAFCKVADILRAAEQLIPGIPWDMLLFDSW
jgi:hypothetical protein